jgi:aquaporin Z
MRSAVRPLVAEFVGTFFFVFIGCAVVVINAARDNRLGLDGIAFAHGLAFGVAITATMAISGGHLNPAVTFAVWAAGRIRLGRALQYIVAQLAAAVVAALVVKALYPDSAGAATGYGMLPLAADVGFGTAILIEAVLTAFLVSAVFGTAVSPQAPRVGGFAIGLTLIAAILVGGPMTGAALNPARAFGPAAVSLDWHAHLVYWLGPLLGAAAAAFVWSKVLLPLPGDGES